MSTIELKKFLVHKIAEIDDLPFLNALKTIIESKKDQKIYPLSHEQREEIQSSVAEVQQGYFIEQKELDKEFEKWLKEK